jgi:hypothetical protein
VIEERRDSGMQRLGVDERRAERTVRMRPAGEQRHAHAVAARLDPAGEQPDQLLLAGRTHQHGAGVGRERRRGRERKGRLVEPVRLDRAAGERLPLGGDAGEPGERAPFGGERDFARGEHAYGIVGAYPYRRTGDHFAGICASLMRKA